MHFRFLMGVVLLGCSCSAPESRNPYPYLNISNSLSIEVKNLKGASFNWKRVEQNLATVFIFISPECPLCENYSLSFKQLINEYKDDGIELIGILPGNYYPAKQVKQFLDQYKISDMEVLMDVDYVLCNYFDAKVTPEVFMVDARNETIYQGKIDNWMYKLGFKRTVVTEFYVKDAIEALLNNTDILVTKTEAVGCIIE